MKRLSMIICAVTVAAPMFGQNQVSADTRKIYANARDNLLRAAEKMPEENYSFKPAESVRSFAQLVGHVADTQYLFCAAATGEKPDPTAIEKTRTAKADLIESLKAGFAYCDAAYDSLTDANAASPVKFGGNDWTRGGILNVNNTHDMEHYGNMATYLRMKGLVPPSSEPKR
jgi:uncharacterized damage-inducible protein DinB